jgi:hypothetical protein
MRFHQLATINAGKIAYNKEKMEHLISNLYDGNYLISFQRLEPKSSVKDYRACYFAKIDALGAEVGETRYGMHGLVKDSIIDVMIDEVPQVFLRDEASTKYLTLEGWTILLERLDIWAFTEYNVILQ